MIDKLKKIDEYLKLDIESLYITPKTNPIITEQTIIILNFLVRQYGFTKVSNFIRRGEDDKKHTMKFIYKTKCKICSSDSDIEIGVTELKNHLSNKKLYKNCKSCDNSIRNKELESNQEYLIRLEKEKVLKTKNYIDTYLDSNNKINESLKLYEKWSLISGDYMINWDVVKNHINQMNYREFLKTPYWNVVSQQRKKQASFQCQLCSSNKNLETHHSTYSIRGEEIHNMKLLTVLCHNCHDKFHTKEK